MLLLFDLKGSGKPRDASADDGNARHFLRLPEAGAREPDGAYSSTKRARFFTLSTGVSGRMPCPRLKMRPGRPAARRRISSARDFSSFQSAKSNTGSRFPCTAAL